MKSSNSPLGTWHIGVTRWWLVLACFFVALSLASFPSQSADLDSADLDSSDDELVVVVHPGLAGESLPLRGLRATFGLRIAAWPNGDSVSVYILEEDSEEHILFCKTILRMLPYVLRRNWDRYLFSGTGHAPVIVKDFTEMKRRIAATPGAIGYLPRKLIDDTVAILEVK